MLGQADDVTMLNQRVIALEAKVMELEALIRRIGGQYQLSSYPAAQTWSSVDQFPGGYFRPGGTGG